MKKPLIDYSDEVKRQIVREKLEGKTWAEIAKNLGIEEKWRIIRQKARTKWYKKIKAELEGKKNEGKEKETPGVEKKEDKEVKEKKDEKKDIQTIVDKEKKKAGKVVDKEVEKHIKTSDKKPPGEIKKDREGKDKDELAQGKKKDVSERKSTAFGMWALLAIILAVVVIAIIFLLLRPRPEERAEYNKPTKEKSTGFEGRSIEDL